jgi:hypothetical protein
MIDQFIAQATSQLGISTNDAEEATSGLLSLLKSNADGADFSSLLSNFGGAEDLMNKFDAGNSLGGGLMGAVGGLLGGQTGGNLAMITSLVSQLNLDTGQLGSLGAMFFDFIKGQAGESLANSVMGGLGDFIQGNQAA